MTNVEDAKAAAEAAVQEHFALRKEQTERIRKAKAGGVKGELSSTHLPPQPQLPPPPPPSQQTHVVVLIRWGRKAWGRLSGRAVDSHVRGGNSGGFLF